MEAILKILVHTPWWVYVVFSYLMFIGVRSLKTRVVPFWLTILFPLVITPISLTILTRSMRGILLDFVIFALALFALGYLGYFLTSRQDVVVDRTSKNISIPGSWVTLFYVMIIFFTKYYFNYTRAVHPHLLTEDWFRKMLIVFSGMTLGYLWGRFARYFYLYLAQRIESISEYQYDSLYLYSGFRSNYFLFS